MLRLLPLFVVVAGLTACVTTEVKTYYRVPGTNAEQVYLSPGADFSKYTKLYAFPLEVYYLEGEESPSKEEIEKVRAVFRDAFLTAIGDDYQIVDEPAKDALGVRGSLVDLKENQSVNDLPSGLDVLVTSGQLTFFMELTDSKSGDVLIRAADHERSVEDPDTHEAVTEGLDAAAERWAGLFRKFLDQNLGKR